ncbi:MAG: hypothetical protein HY699_05010, partial [Deltaproteobacteria bacterium]|nr:hypothetical protein [Deltaproteobacteria bacterium]
DVVPRDLAVESNSEGLRELAVNVPDNNPPGGAPPAPASLDKTGAQLKPGLNESTAQNWIGKIAMPNHSPGAVAYDPSTQLLFVADGTNGLAIIDLSVPGGSSDGDDTDSVDDRVLGTVNLGGAQARAVAVFRDTTGGLVTAVATGAGGMHFMRVLAPQTVAPSAGFGSSGASPAPAAQTGTCCCADDGNPCTEDQCLNGICVHPRINSLTCCNGRAYDSTTQCCEDAGPIAKCVSNPSNFSAPCIAELSRCPDRSPRLNFPNTTNGCGYPIAVVPDAWRNNPAGCIGAEFGTGTSGSPLACDYHDFCYGQCYTPTNAAADEFDRKGCDDQFYTNMSSICSGLGGMGLLPSLDPLFLGQPCFQACSQSALLYYSIVRSSAGRDAYEASQRTSCQCCA